MFASILGPTNGWSLKYVAVQIESSSTSRSASKLKIADILGATLPPKPRFELHCTEIERPHTPPAALSQPEPRRRR